MEITNIRISKEISGLAYDGRIDNIQYQQYVRKDIIVTQLFDEEGYKASLVGIWMGHNYTVKYFPLMSLRSGETSLNGLSGNFPK